MAIDSNLPRSEMMANWTYHLMRMLWKMTDVLKDPSRALDDFDIQEGSTVIDYGCGPGRYLKRASEQVGHEGRVYAVDIHDIAIDCAECIIAKNELDNVIPIKAVDYFVPIPEDTADLIYVLDVFHMISNPTLFLHELHRLVKADGRLILEDGHQKRKHTITKVLASKRWSILNETDKHLVLKPIYKIYN